MTLFTEILIYLIICCKNIIPWYHYQVQYLIEWPFGKNFHSYNMDERVLSDWLNPPNGGKIHAKGILVHVSNTCRWIVVASLAAYWDV